MTDWTLIITTLGASGISATTAYWIAKRGSEATARQVDAETTRTREQIEAENERLQAQHREDHLQNRQNTYHAFLNVEREAQSRFSAMSQPMSRAEYDAWQKRFFDLFNGVLLFGAGNVRPPMEALREAHGQVYGDFMRDTSDKPFGEKMRLAYYAHVDEVLSAREDCLAVMRDDVRPR